MEKEAGKIKGRERETGATGTEETRVITVADQKLVGEGLRELQPPLILDNGLSYTSPCIYTRWGLPSGSPP